MRRALAPLLAAVLVLTFTASTASAAQVVQRTWRASLGTGAIHGREVLTGYTDGTGQLDWALVGLKPSTHYTGQVWAGTCSSLKTRITNWKGAFVTDATGAATATRLIPSSQMNNIWYYGRRGNIAIKFYNGTSHVCGNLSYYRATRVYIPSYKINLPVVPGPNGYPYCNVAMYQRILWQPNEPGATFIYAHGRVGMFLPLLTASKINNGAAMVGKTVYVYTSDSLKYTYKITRVRRHVTSVQSAVGVTSEQLWLQTSEGSNYTYPKLVIIAKRVAVEPVSYAESHPKPHIVKCG
jgi:hypothetical protein